MPHRSKMPVLIIAWLVWAGAASAAVQGKRWSVSPIIGISSPRLKNLNDGEFAAPLPGQGRLTLPGSGDNINSNFIIDNTLEPIDWGTDAGVEFQLQVGAKDALLFGFSVWEGGSTSSVFTEIPFQGELTPTVYERSGKISYFEYYLGWKRDLFRRPRKYNVYSKLSLRELFDIDYKEEFVFAFQGGPSESFKRVIVTESQATGVLMLELAMGFEYFLADWVSLGVDAGYSFGFSKFKLGDASKKDDIQGNDNIRFKLPSILGANGKLQYLATPAPFDDDPSYEQNFYRPLKLDFNGWRSLFRVNFYF